MQHRWQRSVMGSSGSGGGLQPQQQHSMAFSSSTAAPIESCQRRLLPKLVTAPEAVGRVQAYCTGAGVSPSPIEQQVQQQRWQRRQQRWQRRRGRRRRQQSSGRRWRQCAIHHRAAACGWDRGGTLEAGIGGAPGGGGGIGGGRWERGPDDDAPPPGRGRPGCQRTRRRHQRRGRWWPRWGRAVGAARATAADGGGGYHLLPAGNGRRQSGAERGACGGRQPSGRSIQCASHQCRLPRRARHHVAVYGGCDRTGRPRCQRLRDRSRPALGGAD